MDQEKISEIIIQHYRGRPHYTALEEPFESAGRVNYACGDDITVYIRRHNGIITNISYTGNGCSMCIASAEIMCIELRGKAIAQAEESAKNFITSMNTSTEQNTEHTEQVSAWSEDIRALLSLRSFPIRKKCVLISWQILLDLLQNKL